MISTGSVQDRLQRVFGPTQGGVVGLTNRLLLACIGNDVEFERVGDTCVCRWTEGADARETPMPLAPAAFRTILARVAALCNEQTPDAVSPYGGECGLVIDATEVLVRFINTPHAQKLEIKYERDHGDLAKGAGLDRLENHANGAGL